MKYPSLLAVVVISLLLGGVSRAYGDAAQNDPRWATAMGLHNSGQYDAAADLLQELLDDFPNSQPTAARLSISLHAAARYAQSLSAANKAVALNPYAEGWAELGYLYKARACTELGCITESLEAIDILKKRFPDSVAATQAEILEADINGIVGGASAGDLADEYAADQLVTQALRAASKKDYDEAITILDSAIANYPHTRRSLYAIERKAYVLSTQPEWTLQAQSTFLDIITAVRGAAPHSRIRYDAEFRVGALHQRQDMPFEAMIVYEDLVPFSLTQFRADPLQSCDLRDGVIYNKEGLRGLSAKSSTRRPKHGSSLGTEAHAKRGRQAATYETPDDQRCQ